MLRGVAQAAMRVADDLRKPKAGTVDHLITDPSPTAFASSSPGLDVDSVSSRIPD
jgi:hypothetical protein